MVNGQQRRLVHSHSVILKAYQVWIWIPPSCAVLSWSREEFWEGNDARVNFWVGYTSLRVRVVKAVWFLEARQLCGCYRKATRDLEHFQMAQDLQSNHNPTFILIFPGSYGSPLFKSTPSPLSLLRSAHDLSESQGGSEEETELSPATRHELPRALHLPTEYVVHHYVETNTCYVLTNEYLLPEQLHKIHSVLRKHSVLSSTCGVDSIFQELNLKELGLEEEEEEESQKPQSPAPVRLIYDTDLNMQLLVATMRITPETPTTPPNVNTTIVPQVTPVKRGRRFYSREVKSPTTTGEVKVPRRVLFRDD